MHVKSRKQEYDKTLMCTFNLKNAVQLYMLCLESGEREDTSLSYTLNFAFKMKNILQL